MNHTISVIVPCYQQGEYLSETLNSVLNQTYPYWECIIVNDGSTDNTKEVAALFCQKDNRFHYIEKENQGPSIARNTGINASQGEFILPLDADDIIAQAITINTIKNELITLLFFILSHSILIIT